MTEPDTTYNDYPLAECASMAERIIASGGTVFQKFTCQNCGSRLTIDEPNVFYTSGTCDKCHHETDIQSRGCNYLVIYMGKPRPSP